MVFDGIYSYGHVVLGGVAAALPARYGLLLTLGFVLYQLSEVEPAANKTGDFIEFATGYFLVSK